MTLLTSNQALQAINSIHIAAPQTRGANQRALFVSANEAVIRTAQGMINKISIAMLLPLMVAAMTLLAFLMGGPEAASAYLATKIDTVAGAAVMMTAFAISSAFIILMLTLLAAIILRAAIRLGEKISLAGRSAASK